MVVLTTMMVLGWGLMVVLTMMVVLCWCFSAVAGGGCLDGNVTVVLLTLRPTVR